MIRCAIFLVTGLTVATACSNNRSTSDEGAQKGTLVIETSADPDALFPPFATTLEARQATELIYEYLADVGPAMNTLGDAGFEKELASSWRWARDSLSIAFTINPDARWQDGLPVTAKDIAFSYSLYTDPHVASAVADDLGSIDSVTATGTEAVFWFHDRSPQQFYDAASQMLILPSHLLEQVARDSLRAYAASHAPVGSGPYRYSKWDHGSSVELATVRHHYRLEPNIARILWSIVPDYDAAITRLLAGDGDLLTPIRRETVAPLQAQGTYRLVSLPGMDYAFMAFNLRDPRSGSKPHKLFASRDLRRALTMAIDRRSIARSLFDTLASPSIGPTVRAYATTDTTIPQLPFDRMHAEALLDSIGWKRQRNEGIRERNGVPLAFSAIVPVSSKSRMSAATMIQEQLRSAGVKMNIDAMDFSAFLTRQANHDFDAALAAWHVGSSPSAVRDAWTSAATGRNGNNYGGYRNPLFDAQVDSAIASRDQAKAREHYTRAYEIIVADAPAVWLYEPRTLIAIHKRIETAPMRPSGWWLSIPKWKISGKQALPRDR